MAKHPLPLQTGPNGRPDAMQKKHRNGRASTKTSVEDEIAHLRGLDLKGLRSRWQSVLQGSAPASSKSAPRTNTKHSRIVAMLGAPAGATIAAMMTATDWQQHSVRGFLAGVVRKKLGLNLVSEQTDKGRVYRIKDGKASPAAADRAKRAA